MNQRDLTHGLPQSSSKRRERQPVRRARVRRGWTRRFERLEERTLLAGDIAVPLLPGESPDSCTAGLVGAATVAAAETQDVPEGEAATVPQVELETIVTGLSGAVSVTNADDGSNRLFVVEQGGRIRIVADGALQSTPFLDITSRVRASGEQGLLGLAFHPQFASAGAAGEGKFYIYYSAPPTLGGNHDSVIAEYQVSSGDPDLADFSSERVLLRFSQPASNHNGGDLQFGPDDGLLYISSGDGGGSGDPGNNAQNRSNLLGTILRIDVDGTNGPGGQYGIPASNPFVGETGVREEIYAYGFRNPYRMSFDDGPSGAASPDRLFVGDVGQNAWEEVDLVTAGGNYGWRYREGMHPFNGTPPSGLVLIDPIAEYANSAVGISVIGGYVYRGQQFPSLMGTYIFADFNGRMMELTEMGGGWTRSELDVVGGNPIGQFIRGFGQDESRELYVVSSGTLFKVNAVTSPGESPVRTIDNGDEGFSTVGSWGRWLGQGFLSDVHEAFPGNGSAVASWTFTGLNPGTYRVSTTWTTYSNRATNSRFTVLDGATEIASSRLNQQLPPNDFNGAGVAWEDLGTDLAVTGDTLIVRLDNDANGRINADGVRIERVGELADGPEIQVLAGATSVADGSSVVDFGTTPPGSPVTRTFTVTNVGSTELSISGPIELPGGFSSTFVPATLTPGSMTTFDVTLGAGSLGSFVGELSFGTNDADETPFNFTIQGSVATTPVIQIIDNGASGFSTVGAWSAWGGQGYQGDVHESLPGNGSAVASWAFTGISSGVYRVSATWSVYSNRATNSPFTVLVGTTEVGTVAVNQQVAPTGFSDAGGTWDDLGEFPITTGELLVQLRNNANGRLNADAIRIERTGSVATGPEIQVLDGNANIADGTGEVAFGTTPPGSPLTRVLTLRNVGTENLTLSGPIQLPSGFQSDFSPATVSPGSAVSLSIMLTAGSAGEYVGEVSFGSNDADESPFNFSVRGTVAVPPIVRIIDNGDAGFTTTGEWTRWTGQGHLGDVHESLPGSGSDVARWTFTGLMPGVYQVAATWSTYFNRATDSPFSVLDGTVPRGTVNVNQRLAPSGFSDAGGVWQPLSDFDIASDTLVVELRDNANGRLNADAVRIERVGALPATAALSLPTPTLIVPAKTPLPSASLLADGGLADGKYAPAELPRDIELNDAAILPSVASLVVPPGHREAYADRSSRLNDSLEEAIATLAAGLGQP